MKQVGQGWERPPVWALAGSVVCLVALAAGAGLWQWSSAASPAGTASSEAPASTERSSGSTSRASTVPVERPEGRPLRVLFVGDSLMWGSFASHESLTYRALITEELGLHGAVEAVTVGGPGVSAAEATAELAGVEGPFDLVFVEVGANDSVSISPAQFGSDYTALLARVRALAPRAGLVCDGVWNGPEHAAGLDRELRPVCAAEGGVVVPLSELYVDEAHRGPEGSRLPGGRVRDQFHPNDAGHAAIAASMLAALDL